MTAATGEAGREGVSATLESRAGDASREEGKLPGRSEGKEARGEEVRLDGWAGVDGWGECEDNGAGVASELGGGAGTNHPNVLQGWTVPLPFLIKRVERRGGRRGCN